MTLLESLVDKLARHPKRIVFPEGADPRILQAARTFATRQLGVPILVGDRAEIKDRARRLDLRLEGIRILDPQENDDEDLLIDHLRTRPRFRDLDGDAARALVRQNATCATLLLATNRAEALCGGATSTAASALRPIFQIIPTQPGVKAVSSMLVLDMETTRVGLGGILFMADCGVIPEPTVDQLADIGLTTAAIGHHLTGARPRVAYLAFSTHAPTPKHPSIERMRAAAALARERAARSGFECDIEAELQVDAALDAATAAQKGLAGSPVAGHANVLVFPDLNSGNIAAKMVTLIAGVRSYGQILTGLERPCAEISRGAHAHDIFGAAVIVGAQAIDRNLLYGPTAGRPLG